MHRADSPKPPVAPKPKTTSPLTPMTTPKFTSSPRPDSLHSPNSMSRGPKPPIAPKPRLSTPSEWRASVYVINSLNKCSNGKLLCVDRGLYEEHRSNLECSESEADEDYIVVPKAPPKEDEPRDSTSAENAVMISPAAGEEECQEGGEESDPEGMGAAEDLAAPAEGVISDEADGGTAPTPEDVGVEDSACDLGAEEQTFTREEEEKLVEEHNMYNLEDGGPWDGEAILPSDVILTQVDLEGPAIPSEEPGPPGTPREEGEGGEEGSPNTELGAPDECVGSDRPPEGDAEDASKELTKNEGLASSIQEAERAIVNPEVSKEECEDTIASGDQDEPPDQNEKTDQEEMAAVTQEVGEDPREGRDPVQDEPAEESCQIIPFENDGVDDFVTSLSGSPYEFFPTESTSFCSESYSSLSKSAGGLESQQEPQSAECAEQDPIVRASYGAGEGPSVPDVVVMTGDEDAGDDALTNPYEMGVDLDQGTVPGEGEEPETQAASDTLSAYGTKEEMNSDAEGGLVPTDRKNIIARARPHSGKVAGYVPETVPEEIGPEAGSSAIGIKGATKEARKTVLSLEGKPLEASRALPAKPRAFTLYPRSFSVEGREIPVSLYRESEASSLDDHRIKRKDDNLSLPCVIGSSGSFSQRNHLPSSGTSTPSSVVDIPPPFDLACITKKPITKSSPSLLIETEPPDKYTKKKKSSFKKFLALTFKKKSENKVHVDVNVSSSRSSSESSYHGPARLLEIDRRSLSNSPQLKARTGKLRASESPSSLIFYRDGKRKGVPFSRTVSRVESFEDRSRPPFLPLPLTKPRSISFPNADTSDYENIPAMNSDYENIQIPPRRPARAGTFTKLFEDQSRALSTANENDGYVDMSSFNAFESKQQSTDQEAESAYTEPYKVCPISAAAPKEDLSSDEEQGSSEEEDSVLRDPSLTHKMEGQSRAHVIAQELLSSEKAYVEMLQHLHLDFHGAVTRALDEIDQEGKDTLSREELRRGLSELPAIRDLHQGILEELGERLLHWEGQQKVADVFLAREQEFDHHAAHILQFDRYLSLLSETCLHSPRLAAAVREFESQQGGGQNVKHRLLRVVQRLFQYQVLLTDYLNNLCPDSAEYDNTQGALTLISKVTDRANDSMEQGENLQKLVHIEHSVRGQGDLLQPGREFLKEGTLMKVTGKSRRPRHLFLMSDVLLYTYPQKDGKYRLKNTLSVASMKVSRPVMEKVPYALKIETPQSCLTLSASSCAERDEWHSCLSRALPEDYKAQALAAFHHSVEIRERLGVSLGERPPTLVPVTHVMMCMNCGCDFSLTLRRHHCHACGKIVCRNCSRNKYPLKYLKDRMAKVCDGCYGELKKRGGDVPGLMRERPVSMSFPLSSPRFSSSAFSSVFHSINPSTFKKQKKVPSALTEVAASGEGSAISGYLSRCKKGKRHWKKLWFVIKGKVLYTYMASEDTVAMESMPLLGFTIAPEKEEGSSEVGPIFHLYHKKTLFYSFKAEDTNSAQRWIEAMEDASVL
ncbi:FYVE, RhoGEF and PH domain-containing protein 5 isoform X2 [Canis lupus baileyi]|uniref:FYVE, RhoGEF and PH domain-containing protein 5 isoform X2 n=1 Tax=Canis lupus familiaris TaxID=9615 RepID=UPI0003AE6461|nr:FYVE, RhoGEF and PH domain-containing protein 5 isoform X2 [Canis lupus familiaris]XP_025304901.1 FYVE, RhoGEF and PH domain-containing protein 5 isoform X2 [Canis lupus dingo]XP_038282781.1 FYVE, RhoGEF and PH domain-containing protein 5 isoform X2 [Canis lupus familiaris]XP_038421491.1 FYVE, RhoGEF and PH domain-containing protein 5 isoform X2 [Canis lupus familiaris]|eukprot:XP_022262054.1 FYVE, RhoGEF and PH domain-containing protein 5 isoform X2 [Canis lupus familiaris]